MPRQPEFGCKSCEQRRESNRRYYAKPGIREQRFAASAEYKRKRRAAEAGKEIR